MLANEISLEAKPIVVFKGLKRYAPVKPFST
jgi:hypothetical protein